jgi:hypothetical protein
VASAAGRENEEKATVTGSITITLTRYREPVLIINGLPGTPTNYPNKPLRILCYALKSDSLSAACNFNNSSVAAPMLNASGTANVLFATAMTGVSTANATNANTLARTIERSLWYA